jgi:glycine/D-amino acid oxidase-like deaminating enzyme
VYPRPDGTVYICGIGGSDYVSTSELRQNSFLYNCPPNEQRAQAALSAFQSMVSARSVAYSMRTKDELDRSQACMRPCPPDAMPYMGSIPGYDGLYINAGHNCWYVDYLIFLFVVAVGSHRWNASRGIAWAPACGLAMAELLLYGRAKSIDLSPFRPARFTPSLAKFSRGRKQGTTNVGEQW